MVIVPFWKALFINFVIFTKGKRTEELSVTHLYFEHLWNVLWRYEWLEIISKSPFTSCFFCSTPAAGYFNDDDVPDIFVRYNHGKGFPLYYYSEVITTWKSLLLLVHCFYVLFTMSDRSFILVFRHKCFARVSVHWYRTGANFVSYLWNDLKRTVMLSIAIYANQDDSV